MILPHKILRLIVIFCVFAFLFSCQSLKQSGIRKDISKEIRQSPVFDSYFVGFSLYDTNTDRFIAGVNDNKYFTPASNTKILTLAAWLNLGLDSIPMARLWKNNSNLLFQPLGDPTFLHPDFPNQRFIESWQNASYDTLLVVRPDTEISPFGSGWAWDDYSYDYQAERGIFPLYGNTVYISGTESGIVANPGHFGPFISTTANRTLRQKEFNLFEINDLQPPGKKPLQIPFVQSPELTIRLLADTLKKPVVYFDGTVPAIRSGIFNSQPRLPVLALMMQRSDNFIAEQLIINAQLYKGFSSPESFIAYTNRTLFGNLPDSLIWVDGSGLSRYNMFTPRSLVKVLEMLHQQLSWNEITTLFPTGGVSGTIRRWYADDTPYVFAKTGTLRHNHCLSGFLKTKSGRILIFSFMNNHYTGSTNEVRQAMQGLLEQIRDTY